jgi:Tfp pilus assembly protein PilO
MVLSKRERMILVWTVAVVGIALLYNFVISPILDARAEFQSEKQKLTEEIEKAKEVLSKKEALSKEWGERIDNGLNDDVSATESGVLNAIRIWAQNYGLTLSSVKPERERSDSKGEMKEISFNMACSGNMTSVGQFLWQIENSTLPLRITEFQLGSREDDGKEMSLQLKLSALYMAGAPEKTVTAAPSKEVE